MNKEEIKKINSEDELNNEVGKEAIKLSHKEIDIDDNSLDVYADEESNGIGYELKI